MNTDEIAEFIKEYYGIRYGKIAAEAFKQNPDKYITRIIQDKKLQGILVFNDKLNRASIKILAGKQEIIKKLIGTATLDNRILEITVPESMNDYVKTLKETGFTTQNKTYSSNLKEYLLKMTYYEKDI